MATAIGIYYQLGSSYELHWMSLLAVPENKFGLVAKHFARPVQLRAAHTCAERMP